MKLLILVFSILLSVTAYAAPTATLTATPTSGVESVAPTLTWSSVGATACNASASPVNANWLGSLAASGSSTLPAITTQTVFTITCAATADNIVTLAWDMPLVNTDGTPMTDFDHFNVYQVISSGTDVLIATTSGVTQNVGPFVAGTYSFKTSAVNQAGVESIKSNPASKTVVEALNVTTSVTVNVTKKPSAPTNLTAR